MKKLLFSDGYDWLIVDDPLGHGGESTVYEARVKTGRRSFFSRPPALAVAIHNNDPDLPMPEHYEFLIGAIGGALSGIDSVAVPLGVVREAPGKSAIGFLMPHVDGWPLDEVTFHGAGARIAVAHSLALAVAEIEDCGLLWSDAKPNNVMCRKGGRVVLIDALSFSAPGDLTWPDGSVGPWHSRAGDEQWYAPENLQGGGIEHTPHSASWGLACVLYRALKADHPARMLSMDGHPLALPKDATGDLFGRWSVKPPSNQIPADFGIPYGKLPDEIRWYFDQAFRFGRTQPDQRPSARMWAEALGRWVERRRKKKSLIFAGCGCGIGAAALAAIAAVPQPPALWPAPPPAVVAKAPPAKTSKKREARRGPRPALWSSLQDR